MQDNNLQSQLLVRMLRVVFSLFLLIKHGRNSVSSNSMKFARMSSRVLNGLRVSLWNLERCAVSLTRKDQFGHLGSTSLAKSIIVLAMSFFLLSLLSLAPQFKVRSNSFVSRKLDRLSSSGPLSSQMMPIWESSRIKNTRRLKHLKICKKHWLI